jgi:hypothetical protein
MINPGFTGYSPRTMVHIGAADRGGGDANHGFAGPRHRFGQLLDGNLVLCFEDNGLHGLHMSLLGWLDPSSSPCNMST